jgi:hypothetical protein
MYTTGKQIVDAALAYYDNTDGSTMQNTTVRRARLLHYLQRTAEDIWFHRPWPFSIESSQRNFTSGTVAVPANFAQVSAEGGLFDLNGRTWVEIPHQDMLYLRLRGHRANDHIYSIGGNAGQGSQYIYLPSTGLTVSMNLVYQTVCPTVVDDPFGEGYLSFPQPFGEALLLGTVAKLKGEEGDARQDWRADYARALARAGASYTKKTRPQMMPQSVGGMW